MSSHDKKKKKAAAAGRGGSIFDVLAGGGAAAAAPSASKATLLEGGLGRGDAGVEGDGVRCPCVSQAVCTWCGSVWA